MPRRPNATTRSQPLSLSEIISPQISDAALGPDTVKQRKQYSLSMTGSKGWRPGGGHRDTPQQLVCVGALLCMPDGMLAFGTRETHLSEF